MTRFPGAEGWTRTIEDLDVLVDRVVTAAGWSGAEQRRAGDRRPAVEVAALPAVDHVRERGSAHSGGRVERWLRREGSPEVAAERAARRTRESGPVSAELIEREAVRLFSERSYPVIGMRDIGDAVGLLPGSLYVHISSKEALLLRIVERGIQNYLDEIGAVASTEAPAADRLRAAVVAHFRVLARTLDQTRVAFHQWTYLGADKHPAVVAMRQRYEDLFADIVRDGVTSGEFRPVRDVRVTVLAIIGMLNSAPGWYSPDGALSPEEIGAEIAELALGGMVGR